MLQKSRLDELEAFPSQLPSGIQIDVSAPPESTQAVTQITVETRLKPELLSIPSLELPADLKPSAPACSIEAISQLLEQLEAIDPAEYQRSDDLNPFLLERLHLAEILVCGDAAISGVLKALAYSQTQRVHLIAVEVLEKIDSPEAIQALIQALETTPHADVKAAISRILGDREIEEAVPSLVSVLQAENDVWARQVLVEALGKIGGEEATDALLEMRSDEDEQVRYAVISALGATGNTSVVPALIEILRSEGDIASIRQAAAKGLGNFGTEAVISLLIQVLRENCDAVVRSATVTALGNSVVLLGKQDPAARKSIEADVIFALVVAFDDPSLSVRRNAVLALIQLDSEAAKLALEQNNGKVIKIMTLSQPNVFLISAAGVTNETKEHYEEKSYWCLVTRWC